MISLLHQIFLKTEKEEVRQLIVEALTDLTKESVPINSLKSLATVSFFVFLQY
jgi:hypothetical protein